MDCGSLVHEGISKILVNEKPILVSSHNRNALPPPPRVLDVWPQRKESPFVDILLLHTSAREGGASSSTIVTKLSSASSASLPSFSVLFLLDLSFMFLG